MRDRIFEITKATDLVAPIVSRAAAGSLKETERKPESLLGPALRFDGKPESSAHRRDGAATMSSTRSLRQFWVGVRALVDLTALGRALSVFDWSHFHDANRIQIDWKMLCLGIARVSGGLHACERSVETMFPAQYVGNGICLDPSSVGHAPLHQALESTGREIKHTEMRECDDIIEDWPRL